ncbi:MAG: creatininase family protein [Planctomycetes bacterium]|nr:creatininase family protein [Planctomycetota bacterium]
MNVVRDYIPHAVNKGSWLTAYTLNELKLRTAERRVVFPICSIGTPFEEIAALGEFVLPPLYHEALDAELKQSLLAQIHRCFPYYEATRDAASGSATVDVVEMPRSRHDAPARPRILGFSVDTAVEQHGPHLPLATDTIQSYAVLARLAEAIDGFLVGPPVEYGHLTWGLPFGMSIDITPPLLTRYVTGFANAMQNWIQPESMYVVDVHGSIVHRTAIIDGLKASSVERFAFRWLYDPIVEFAGDRGDQHAGGVETAMVELASPELVDRRWWPERVDELEAQQMDLATAVELTPDLPRFVEHAESRSLNGIVGDVRNYYNVDAPTMLARMLDVARSDLQELAGV